MDWLNKVLGWITWNDRLSGFILLAIIGLWVCDGKWISLNGEVRGSLIIAFGLIIQYYFRKKPDSTNGNGETTGKAK